MLNSETVKKWNLKAIGKVWLGLFGVCFNLVFFVVWIRQIALQPVKFPVNYIYLVPFFATELYTLGGYIVLIRNPKGKFWRTDTFNLLLIALSLSCPIDSRDFKIISGSVALYTLFIFFVDRMLNQMQAIKEGGSSK